MSRVAACLLCIALLAGCAAAPVTAPPRSQTLSTPPSGASPSATPPNPYLPQAADSALQRGTATIESAQVVVRESYPPQYVLALKGTLPTPCHQLRIALSAPDGRKVINAQVYSVVDASKICIQVLAPFEATIGLSGYAEGRYTLTVNGLPAGEVEIATPHALKGYELYSWQEEEQWYFALLPGTNRIKTYDEITDPQTRLHGLEALKARLRQLPAGEWVLWTMPPGQPGLALPAEQVVAEIRAYCLRRGLRFNTPPS